MRRQEQGKLVDSFITALYELAEHCGYGNLNDKMIRDRLVVGLGDSKLSEKLQLDPELTLEKAITQVCQAEIAKQQQPLLQGESNHRSPETPIKAVHKNKKTTTSKTVTGQQKSEQIQRSTSNVGTCSHCGKSPFHDRKKCAAREAVCHKCGKKGHFQSVWRSANVRGVHSSHSQPSDDNFLGVVTSDEKTDDPWTVTLQLNNGSVDFHFDTGAEVTVVSETIHKKVGSPSLTQSDQTLRSPIVTIHYH